MVSSVAENRDCMDAMAKMDDESVGYFIFSPPYNLGNTSGGGIGQYSVHYSPDTGLTKRGGNGKWKGAALATGYHGYTDNLPHEEYVKWQKDILSECWRLLDSRGAIFYNHKQRIFRGEVVTPLEYIPSHVTRRQIVVWARSGGINFSPSFYLPTSEWIVVCAKGDFRLKTKGASGVGDVWSITQEMDNPHPAPFPLELPARILSTVPNFGKPVCDPFLGSGTTRLAAYNAGFDFIGMELSPDYFAAQEQRFANHIAQGSLFEPEIKVEQGVLL